ncbi:MAG: SurA N-terminal domain-containing protein [bacterium]
MFKITTVRKLISSKKGKKLLKILIFLLVILLLYTGRSLIVAAWVGNRPVLRLSLIKELEKQGGKSVLDSLIEKSLINQAAKKANVNISDDTVNLELVNIEELVKKQGTSLEEALSARGQTKKDLLEQIKLQKIIEQILNDKIVVTDEEIKAYYNANKIEEAFDTAKEGIKNSIIQSKLQTEYTKWITELKEKAKIFYFIKY